MPGVGAHRAETIDGRAITQRRVAIVSPAKDLAERVNPAGEVIARRQRHKLLAGIDLHQLGTAGAGPVAKLPLVAQSPTVGRPGLAHRTAMTHAHRHRDKLMPEHLPGRGGRAPTLLPDVAVPIIAPAIEVVGERNRAGMIGADLDFAELIRAADRYRHGAMLEGPLAKMPRSAQPPPLGFAGACYSAAMIDARGQRSKLNAAMQRGRQGRVGIAI